MQAYEINWTEWDHLLGKVRDMEIARHIGCTHSSVQLRRKKLSIPAVVKQLTTEEEKLLQQGQLKCVDCNEIKSTNDFPKQKRNRTGFFFQCKSCLAKRHQAWTIKLKTKWVERMGGRCQNCGFSQFLASLHFHHVDGGKEHHISYIMSNEEKTIKELAKCCLLCSNCHNAFHAGQLSLTFTRRSLGWTVIS